MLDPSKIKKILILDFSRIGDTIMHDPAFRAIKLQFPHARITALTDRPNFDVLLHHPVFFQVKVFPRVRSRQTLWAFLKMMVWIRRQHFDLLINFYMGGRTATIARYTGIPIRVSFDKKKALCKAYNRLVSAPSTYSNWMVETHELLRPLGIDPASVWPCPRYFIPEGIKLDIDLPSHYACYNLATSDPSKCWAVADYAKLAKALYRNNGLVPVLIGNPGQGDLADEFFIAYPSDCPAVRLPVLRLFEVAAVLKGTELLVTGDTGIMHLAFAIDVPTVAIFTYKRPEYAVSATTNKMVVFREDLSIPPIIPGQYYGVKTLSLDEVQEGVEKLLVFSKKSH